MKLGKRHDESPPTPEVPPEDFYVFEFVDYGEPQPSKFKDERTGEYPMRIRLVFALRDPDVEDKFQGAKASAHFDVEMNALNKKSVYHPLLALDPENDPQGGEDLDEYKGTKCRGALKHRKSGEETYCDIADIKPLRRRRGASTNAEPAEQRELVGAGAEKRRSAFDVEDE